MFRTLIVTLTLIGVATLSSAHSKSEATTPADGATVTDVAELVMRFDDPMRIIAVTLSTLDGEIDIERETGMEPVTLFRALPTAPLLPGVYRMDWRGMASDGHPMQGGFSFTVAE